MKSVTPRRPTDRSVKTSVAVSKRTGQARRRVDKLHYIAKLLTRINEVKDTATLNSLRNEVIKILMTL